MESIPAAVGRNYFEECATQSQFSHGPEFNVSDYIGDVPFSLSR